MPKSFFPYRIPKPDKPKEADDPKFTSGALEHLMAALPHLKGLENPEYLPWEKARHRLGSEGKSGEFLWILAKFRRATAMADNESLIRDQDGKPFRWFMLDRFHAQLHELDLNFGGNLRVTEQGKDMNPRAFILRGIREEAIASSQLEGASTSRAYAKKMISEKRPARNRDDQMIINNHLVMVDIEERLSKVPLTFAELIGMQSRLTQGTVEDQGIVGRLRTDGDEIVVMDRVTGDVYHIPPKRAVLDDELVRLIDYANDEITDNSYMHLVVKAIFIHFWIGYLHPFPDGNGRVARALFYWYLIRHGYWAISYLSISSHIKKVPTQYRDAFLYTEQDDNDLTYFIDFNLRKIGQAAKELILLIERTRRINQTLAKWGKETEGWNPRQLELVRYFAEKPDARTTASIHANTHGVTWITASLDLKNLERAGYLMQLKKGRDRPYVATTKLQELWSKLTR